MSLVVNGTTIPTDKPFKVNGVNVERVIANGVEVWKLDTYTPPAAHWGPDEYVQDQTQFMDTSVGGDAGRFSYHGDSEDLNFKPAVGHEFTSTITPGKYKVGASRGIVNAAERFGVLKWIP